MLLVVQVVVALVALAVLVVLVVQLAQRGAVGGGGMQVVPASRFSSGVDSAGGANSASDAAAINCDDKG
jgi:hypothetical protein